jgi:hypothetical protein
MASDRFFKRILVIILCVVCAAAAAGDAAARQTGEPDNPHGTFTVELTCSSCHTSDAWTPLRAPLDFDHGRDTGFELLEAHALTSCTSCHDGLTFADEAGIDQADCASCHVDVHGGALSVACADCHSGVAFDDIDVITMHAETNFPLTGAHEISTCESCHTDDAGGAFALIDTECVACHESEYLQTTVIPHEETGFGTDCANCHTTAIWPDAILENHAEFADGFQLVGAHRFAGCESCHRTPGFVLVFDAADQEDCIACHRSDFERKHEYGRTPVTCLDCHDQNSWGD